MKKTTTSESIEKLELFQEEVRERINSQKSVMFHIGDLSVNDGKLKYQDQILDTDSTKQVLSHLKVRPNFLTLDKQMPEEDWNSVTEKLKSVSANTSIFARTGGDENLITNLQIAHKKTPNGGIQIPEVFSMLRESLLECSTDDYRLKETNFDSVNDEVTITLLNDNRELDVFGSGHDMWKSGKKLVWSGVEFSITPFFERLVCTNGMTTRQFGYASNVTRSKYNYGKISSILEKEISNASDTSTAALLDAVKHLNVNNISVDELLKYRSLFNEEEHEAILNKYFDISYLNKAYRCDIEGMHKQWRKTADTGKNAYDFLNDLTYIASHPDEIALDFSMRRKLQIEAGNLMFSDLDMQNVAPKLAIWTK